MEIHRCIKCKEAYVCVEVDGQCMCLSETIILLGTLFCDMYFCSGTCYRKFITRLEPYTDDDRLRLLNLLSDALIDFNEQYKK